MVAGDAKDCKGKFASGRTSELLIAKSCSEALPRAGQWRSTDCTVFYRTPEKGRFILFSVLPNMGSSEGAIAAKEERLADFKKAALVVTAE